jgi:hypothetical protein
MGRAKRNVFLRDDGRHTSLYYDILPTWLQKFNAANPGHARAVDALASRALVSEPTRYRWRAGQFVFPYRYPDPVDAARLFSEYPAMGL